jgi:hypothetical protein
LALHCFWFGGFAITILSFHTGISVIKVNTKRDEWQQQLYLCAILKTR